MEFEPIKIIAAAIKVGTNVWSLPQPNRHHNIIQAIVNSEGVDYRQKYGKCPQGFILSDGRFVEREEAADIAYLAGQIDEPKARLFSEDLW